MARTFLTKCYWILQNARVTAFTISELLRENQQGMGVVSPPPPPLPPPTWMVKTKKKSETSLPASFSAFFLKKNVSLFTIFYLTKFYFLRYWAYCNCLLTWLWRHKFWNQPYLSNQALFSTWSKRQDKYLNILRHGSK